MITGTQRLEALPMNIQVVNQGRGGVHGGVQLLELEVPTCLVNHVVKHVGAKGLFILGINLPE